LARASLAAREYSDALRYFAEASKLRPNEPEPHRGMAEVQTATGHLAEAAVEQRQADRLSQHL